MRAPGAGAACASRTGDARRSDGLKNASDWASRPWGQNTFARKPSGVIGTALARQSLRGVLCFCNSPLMNQVGACAQFKPGLITADGPLTDEGTETFLCAGMAELHAFIVRVLTVLPRASGDRARAEAGREPRPGATPGGALRPAPGPAAVDRVGQLS